MSVGLPKNASTDLRPANLMTNYFLHGFTINIYSTAHISLSTVTVVFPSQARFIQITRIGPSHRIKIMPSRSTFRVTNAVP